ncbi:MAG: ATP-binding protein [Pseudomonadota bacterium]
MIERVKYQQKIGQLFGIHNAVAILGPRQCGKTTLAHEYARQVAGTKEIHVFDLENPLHVEQLQNPQATLKPLSGLIVIDEIQYLPNLFPILRVLIDDPSLEQQYLILGSASRDLIRQSSETLAGRIAYIELHPFGIDEISDWEKLFVLGGFPKSYLASTNELSWQWRENYVRTYLERDIPNLGFSVPPATMRRFWMMLAHYHGQIFNASEIGRSLGQSDKTIKQYLDILAGTFMVRVLQPWFENIGKRQVKRPKIYFTDSGLYHYLINTIDLKTLRRHPKLGASWEGFALEQVIRAYDFSSENCFFWSTHGQAEIDLLVFDKGRRLGFEFKYTDVPKATASVYNSLEALQLDQVQIVYPGDRSFNLAPKIKAVSLMSLANSAA